MNILILGDIFGAPGRIAVVKKLPSLIVEKKINFVIINGENAADNGLGITKGNAEELFNSGADVITTGNHVWDQKETIKFIEEESRLLRPYNLIEGSPGKGYNIFISKNNKKIAVVNLMGNVFMRKSEDVFMSAQKFKKKIKLKKEVDFIVVDIHGETTSEKVAMGHFFDGEATLVVGTHTHVPTSDSRILNGGTAYQTDLGMCGVYDSVIGMNKANSVKKFLKDSSAVRHFPAKGESTICGVIVEADEETGLAKKIEQITLGGFLTERL
jgi:2',3'-cyclic-nucleotide 2'-phosphodiesterase